MTPREKKERKIESEVKTACDEKREDGEREKNVFRLLQVNGRLRAKRGLYDQEQNFSENMKFCRKGATITEREGNTSI